MSLSYGQLADGEYKVGSSSSAYTLTTSYGAANGTFTIETNGLSEVVLYVEYTPQTANNTIEIRVQGSPDSLNDSSQTYYQEFSVNESSGTATLSLSEFTFTGTDTSSGHKGYIFIPVVHKSVQVSVKETVNSGTAGTATVRALVAGVSDK